MSVRTGWIFLLLLFFLLPGFAGQAAGEERIRFEVRSGIRYLVRESAQKPEVGPLAGRGQLTPGGPAAVTGSDRAGVQPQAWEASKVWAYSGSATQGSLLITVPVSIEHRFDTIHPDDEAESVRVRNGLREYLWTVPRNERPEYAPRPALAVWGTPSPPGDVAAWLLRIYLDRKPSRLALGLTRTAGASRSVVLERAAWIHQSLVQGADSLDPALLPEETPHGITTTAGYACDFFSIGRALGWKVSLVIPLSSRYALPLGMPGIRIDDGTSVRWYFPASRVFTPGRVPWFLSGLQALCIAPDGKHETVQLSAVTEGETSYTVRVTADRSARLKAGISGEYTGTDAAIVRAGILRSGRQAFISGLTGNLPASTLAVRHILQLLSPVVLDCALAGTHELGVLEGVLARALRERFQDGRRGTWRDKLVLTLPAGSRIGRLPGPWKRVQNGVEIRSVWTLVRGRAIIKPGHWSPAVWQDWLRLHIPRQPDTLIRERICSVTSSKGGRAVSSLLDDLLDLDRPVMQVYQGGIIR